MVGGGGNTHVEFSGADDRADGVDDLAQGTRGAVGHPDAAEKGEEDDGDDDEGEDGAKFAEQLRAAVAAAPDLEEGAIGQMSGGDGEVDVVVARDAEPVLGVELLEAVDPLQVGAEPVGGKDHEEDGLVGLDHADEEGLLPLRLADAIDPVPERLDAAALIDRLVFAQARLDEVLVLLVDGGAEQEIDQPEKEEGAAGENRRIAEAEPQAEGVRKFLKLLPEHSPCRGGF